MGARRARRREGLRDHAIGWVLWGIGNDPVLQPGWAFKGGTCLKKCYLETNRFSEDLDFTVLPGGPIEAEDCQGCGAPLARSRAEGM